jgi:SAM-dependent methyltransferase
LKRRGPSGVVRLESIVSDMQVFHNQGRSKAYREADEAAVLSAGHQHLSKVLKELSSSFGREISALDLGCGTGRYFHCLHNVARLTGIDLSLDMLREAANPVRNAEIRCTHIDLICGDIFQVPVASAAFDLIYSIGVFLGSSSFSLPMCDQLCALLTPGGKAFVTVADVGSRASSGTYVRLEELMKQSSFEHYEISSYSSTATSNDVAFYECIATKGRDMLSTGAAVRPTSAADLGSGDVVWRNVSRVVEDIMTAVPRSDTFILVDGDLFRERTVLRSRAIPFMEREGRYWGPPRNDDDAIQELERLRTLGATFIVFAWPAFWWFDHYIGLNRYLRSRFRCVVEGELMVGFDLRT